MKYKILFCICAFFVATTSISAQQKPSQKWLDQKFSMFIHFGLYSVYGGVYDGKPVKWGYSEQIQSFAGIFSDWYADKARDFNPVQWNPDSIVALAKAAGMKSIVFTSKHHDGFCMYHSRYTDFNIVDAMPYGKDIMKELADACVRGDIDFSVYFSLIDWHFPQAYPISSHNTDPITPEHYQYNLHQVEEIMTRYGNISEIWFDMGSLTPTQSKGLYELVNRLQPNCMISGRLGNDFVDFAVMGDNEYPDYKLGVPWQTAASMFDETWGYRSWQKRGSVKEKVDEKIRSLVKVISRGGNYLLNIGPRGDGSVVEFERNALLGIGKWVKDNSEAIYGTHANPFYKPFKWGDITTKDGNLYLFVENVPQSLKIGLSGFEGNVKSVVSLSPKENIDFKQTENSLVVDVSSALSVDGIAVFKVSFENGYQIIPNSATSEVLTSQNATPVFGHSSLNYYGGYKSLIQYDWTFNTLRLSIAPTIFFTENEKGKTILLNIDGKEQKVSLHSEKYSMRSVKNKSMEWGRIYKKSGRGVFGFVEEENLSSVSSETLAEKWKKVADFEYGKQYEIPLSPRESVVFLQEIESDKAQNIALEIGSGNAVYILLNGEYITAHFSPERVESQKEIVVLPLKQGKNQLVVKFYNGYAKALKYSIKPLESWKIYSLKLTRMQLQSNNRHTLSLRLAHPDSKVSPLRMNNIKIEY